MEQTYKELMEYINNLTPEQKIKDYIELEEWYNVGPECSEFIAQMQEKAHVKLLKE